jgi:hypothetical protein
MNPDLAITRDAERAARRDADAASNLPEWPERLGPMPPHWDGYIPTGDEL